MRQLRCWMSSLVFAACVSVAGCSDAETDGDGVSAWDGGRRGKPDDDGVDAGAHVEAPRKNDDDNSQRKTDPSASPKTMKRAADAGSGEPKPSNTSKPDDSDAGTQEQKQEQEQEQKTDDPSNVAAVSDIVTVVVDVEYTSNGSGVYPTTRPTILFKDGSACRDMNFVVRGLSVDDHKKMFPKTWLLWREVDGKIQLGNGMKWRVLDFQLRYAPSSPSLTLDQTYKRVSTFVSGDAAAFSEQSARFTKDHRILWGSITGVGVPGAPPPSLPPDRSGTYNVDGYTLEISWDDGTTTKTSFVWSADDPDAVYIGGAGYVVVTL